MDTLTSYILGNSVASSYSHSELGTFAKEASNKYSEDGTSMSDTIRKIASREKLNDEQVRRVIEGANLSAFSAAFGTEFEGNVDYDVADPAMIFGSGVHKTASFDDSDIRLRSRYIPGSERVIWEDVFPSESAGQEKVAATNQWEILDAMHNAKQLGSDYVQKTASFNLQADNLRRVARSYTREGHQPHVVLSLIKSAGVDVNLAAVIIENMPEFHTKVAAKVEGRPDTTQPLYIEAASMAKIAGEVIDLRNRLETIKNSGDPLIAPIASRFL